MFYVVQALASLSLLAGHCVGKRDFSRASQYLALGDWLEEERGLQVREGEGEWWW